MGTQQYPPQTLNETSLIIPLQGAERSLLLMTCLVRGQKVWSTHVLRNQSWHTFRLGSSSLPSKSFTDLEQPDTELQEMNMCIDCDRRSCTKASPDVELQEVAVKPDSDGNVPTDANFDWRMCADSLPTEAVLKALAAQG